MGERDSNATKTLECVRGRRVEPGKGEKKICSGKRRKVDVSNPVNVLGDEQEEEHEDFRDVFNNVLIFSSFYRES